MKKALILFITLLMMFEGTAVCAETDASTGTGASEETVQEAAEQETAPQIQYDYSELTVGATTPFDGSFFTGMWGNVSSDIDVRMLVHGYNLVEWRGEDGAFAVDPSVVSGVVVTQNGDGDRTYTLTLYNDLTYSDGTPITAWDYAFSMLLCVSPEIGEIGGAVRPLNYILGCADYVNGSAPYLAGVRVPQDDTLAITVSHEYLPFFYELALLDCCPYPISVIAPGCRVADDGNGVYIANADESVEERLFTADALRETILNAETGYRSHPNVSSGPYRLISFDGETAVLELNEYYKGNSDGAKPVIPRLIFKTVSNETMMDQLASGEIGLVNKCASAEALQQGTQLVARGSGFAMSNYTRNGMSFIGFCCENAPMNSQSVRQAISMCLDKDGFVADTVGNYGLRVDGYYGIGQWMVSLADGSQTYPVEAPAADAGDEEMAAYEETIAAWQELSLDGVTVYDLNVEEAARLLEADGWNLNREGGAFDPATDDVRCKSVDGEIVALELKLLSPEGSVLNAGLQANFADHLAEAGIGLTVETLPMKELLNSYYRRQARDCHMIMMATNFDAVFDPSAAFLPDGDGINPYNTTAIDDETLFNLAVDMRRTESGDALAYCQKWVAFEERFQEVVPAIPIYSNIYFDFYPNVLHDYNISGSVTWGQAIVGAYLSDAAEEEQDRDLEAESEDPEFIEGISQAEPAA